MRRILAIPLIVLALLGSSATTPMPTSHLPAESYPAPASSPTSVSTELAYAAFPSAVRVGNRDWMTYRHGMGHASPDGSIRLRWRDAGSGWSDPVTVVASPAGDLMYGAAGMSADSAGRIYLGVLRARSTGPDSATDYTAWLTWHEPNDSPATWAPLIQMPTPPGIAFPVLSAVHVHNGEVLLAAYGPTTSGRYAAHVVAFNPATGAFAPRGQLIHASRPYAEPTLATLADGRLLICLRSDGTAPYYSYLHASTSTDAGTTWATPHAIVQHGSGLPSPLVLPNGEVAVAYRGFSEPEHPAPSYPLRVATLRPNGTPASPLTEQGIDLLSGDQRLYLYGAWLAPTETRPAELVYALEGLDGQHGSGANIYSVPVNWLVRSE